MRQYKTQITADIWSISERRMYHFVLVGS